MGDTAKVAIAKAAADAKAEIAKVMQLAVRSVTTALEGRTPQEIAEAFNMPNNEAPAWVDAAKKLAIAGVRVESAQPAVTNNQLNIVIPMPQAIEEWSAKAEAFKAATGGQRKVIEAEVAKK